LSGEGKGPEAKVASDDFQEEGVSHFTPLQKPDQFNAAILSAIADFWKPGIWRDEVEQPDEYDGVPSAGTEIS
jgi:hypothetical protein